MEDAAKFHGKKNKYEEFFSAEPGEGGVKKKKSKPKKEE
jgi:hypothetical protein